MCLFGKFWEEIPRLLNFEIVFFWLIVYWYTYIYIYTYIWISYIYIYTYIWISYIYINIYIYIHILSIYGYKHMYIYIFIYIYNIYIFLLTCTIWNKTAGPRIPRIVVTLLFSARFFFLRDLHTKPRFELHQEYVAGFFAATLPETHIEPENRAGKGDSYWKPSFLAGMLVLGSVNQFQAVLGIVSARWCMFSFLLAFLISMFDKIWLLKITLRNLVLGARNHGHWCKTCIFICIYLYITRYIQKCRSSW